MPAEATGGQSEHTHNQLQNTEQSKIVPTELIEYIDRELLVPLQERRGTFAQHRERRGVGPRQLLNADNEMHTEENLLPRETARVERMRQEVQQGNFAGITTELQARRSEPEKRLSQLRSQLRPPGKMDWDDEYFALKREILAGEQIREKVKGVLDASEQEWISESIEYRKAKQRTTERGRLMSQISNEQQTLDEIIHLQQLISASQS